MAGLPRGITSCFLFVVEHEPVEPIPGWADLILAGPESAPVPFELRELGFTCPLECFRQVFGAQI